MMNRKGTSLILEQVIIALFGIVLMVTAIVAFGGLRSDSADFLAEEAFESVSTNVQYAVVQASSKMDFSDYGRIQLSLPPVIGGKTYSVYLNSTHVSVRSIIGTFNSSVEMLTLDATLSGNISSTAGGKNYVVYNKTANTIVLETLF